MIFFEMQIILATVLKPLKIKTMKFNFLILIIIFLFSSLFSCKKNDVAKSPIIVDSTTIMGFKDSTQLVKSFTSTFYDSSGNNQGSDSTVYFYYDTINKKVILTYQNVSSLSLAYSSGLEILSYNSNGLLIQDKTNPADTVGNGPDVVDVPNIVDFTYDAQNILSSQTVTYFDGSKEATYITKTNNLLGGYTLTYTTVPDAINFPSDSVLLSTSFDAKGNVVSALDLKLPDLSRIQSDSIIYDASGNMMKVIEYGYTDNGATPNGYQTYNLFEFGARDTKGNQLYNLSSLLFNGVSNFGFMYDDPIQGSAFSGFNNSYLYQFTKYPALNVKAFQEITNSYVTFNPNPQYDNLGRLVKYRFYDGDGSNYYEDDILSYYK